MSLLVGLAACGGGGDGAGDGEGADGGGDPASSCGIAEFEDGLDSNPTAGAADGADLYVYSDGGIHRVPASGGEPELVASSRPPSGIVLDETHIYWTTPLTTDGESEIARVPKAGGAVESLLTDADADDRIVGVDSGSVVFIRRDPDSARLQVRDAEGNVTDLADIAGFFGRAATVHDGHVYFGREADGMSGIARIPLAGGTPEWLAMDPEVPGYEGAPLSGEAIFTAEASGLFVASRSIICSQSGIVSRVDWASGEIEFIATEQPCPFGLEVDGTNVVWGLAPDTGLDHVLPWSIVAVPAGGGAPQPVAMGDDTTRVTPIDLAGGVLYYARGPELCRRDL